MAEFSEVMRNIQRRCKLCGQGERWGCTISGSICGRISGMPHDADWRALEKEVMAWVAEHPEPVYPTWGEWFLQTCQVPVTKEGENDFWRTLSSRIPADIAEKLGIEPKEGQHESV